MKTLVFKGIFFCLLLGISLIVFTFFQNNYISKKVSFKIKPETIMTIFGHSHPETAYNDTLINNFQNLSRSAESSFYTYPKLKRILQENEQLEVVFIEVTNNQIHRAINSWIWGDRYLRTRYKYYEPFISLQDQYVLLKNNPAGYLKAFIEARKANSLKILENNYSITDYHKIGGYKHLVRDKTDSLVKAYIKNPPQKTEDYKNLSTTNLAYLDKIISFLKEAGKEFYFIRTPQHHLAYDQENEAFFLSVINKRYGDVEFMDFEKFPIENHEFGDFGHLNYKGARKYSLFFNQILKKGLLKQKNKQEFINQEIATFSLSSEESIKEMYQESLYQFKKEIFTNILETIKPREVNFSFTDTLKINKVYTYSQGQEGTILMELAASPDSEYFKDKAFGVHATFYKKDKHLLTAWHKRENSTKLTIKSIPEFLNVNDKNYILLPYNKECEINEFEKVYLFMINKDKYTGTIGRGLVLDTIKL